MRIQFSLMSPSFPAWPNGRAVGASIRMGYKRVRYEGKWLNHHTLIWEHFNGQLPEGLFVDHIDGNTLNNAPSNLRAVTRSENNRNRKAFSNNASGIKGVYWHKQCEKWYGQAKINGLTNQTGYFDTKEAAHSALITLREELQYDYF